MALASSAYAYSQELVIGGNMSSDASWQTASPMGGSDEASFQFGYVQDSPSLGDGGCLAIDGLGQTRCLAWQEVTIIPGHTYSFSGVVKNGSVDAVVNTWLEVLLSRNVPDPENDYGAGAGDYIYARNTWMSAPWADMSMMDGKLIDETVFSWKGASSSGGDSTLASETIYIPDTVTVTTWYVGLKAGIWNDIGGNPEFIYLFDNISLFDQAGGSLVQNTASDNQSLSIVYPNPSSGQVTIRSNENSEISYTIFSQSGQKLQSGLILDKELRLNLSRFDKGLYFIKVNTASKTEFHKLVLQ